MRNNILKSTYILISAYKREFITKFLIKNNACIISKIMSLLLSLFYTLTLVFWTWKPNFLAKLDYDCQGLKENKFELGK